MLAFIYLFVCLVIFCNFVMFCVLWFAFFLLLCCVLHFCGLLFCRSHCLVLLFVSLFFFLKLLPFVICVSLLVISLLSLLFSFTKLQITLISSYKRYQPFIFYEPPIVPSLLCFIFVFV